MNNNMNGDVKHQLIECLADDFKALIFISEKSLKSKINDLDYIVVVNDSANKIDVIKKYAKTAVQVTTKSNIFVSIYPVFENELANSRAMFIKNINKNGKRIKF